MPLNHEGPNAQTLKEPTVASEINSIGLIGVIQASQPATWRGRHDAQGRFRSTVVGPDHLLGQIPHCHFGRRHFGAGRASRRRSGSSGASLIERRQIARVHPSVLEAISQSVEVDPKLLRSIGVVETFSAASIIEAADTAVKAANITLLRVHLAMALGGKGFLLVAGDVSSVQAAVEAASKVAAEDGMLVGRGVIPAPSKELFRDYI